MVIVLSSNASVKNVFCGLAPFTYNILAFPDTFANIVLLLFLSSLSEVVSLTFKFAINLTKPFSSLLYGTSKTFIPLLNSVSHSFKRLSLW